MLRILALDGGGIKGAFTASVLATLEREAGRRAADHFDLITGTSTGGILAIGLGLGFAAEDLLTFYVERGATIFPSTGLIDRPGMIWRWLFSPKHSHTVLKTELVSILGHRKFGESSTRLVVPTYDAIGGRLFLMKTAEPHRQTYRRQPVVV